MRKHALGEIGQRHGSATPGMPGMATVGMTIKTTRSDYQVGILNSRPL